MNTLHFSYQKTLYCRIMVHNFYEVTNSYFELKKKFHLNILGNNNHIIQNIITVLKTL